MFVANGCHDTDHNESHILLLCCVIVMSVLMLRVLMRSVLMLSVIMPSANMPSAIIPSGTVPYGTFPTGTMSSCTKPNASWQRPNFTMFSGTTSICKCHLLSAMLVGYK